MLEDTLPKPVTTTIPSTSSTVLLRQTDQFFGLDSLLEELHMYVDPNHNNSQLSQLSCCLHGIGGSGKPRWLQSSTASEYTYRYRSSFRHIFWSQAVWLQAEHDEELQDSFALISTTVYPNADALNRKENIAQATGWLRIKRSWTSGCRQQITLKSDH